MTTTTTGPTVARALLEQAYNTDRIAAGGPIRKPFTADGQLWVVVGTGPDRATYEAYRLVPLAAFDGPPTTYAEHTRENAEAARADPNGFYHGIQVRYRGQPHVLSGPPVSFVASDPPPVPTPLATSKLGKNGPATPAVLGVQRVEFERPPLISEDRVLWAVCCHPADHAEPLPLEWYKAVNGGEARATRAVEELRRSTLRCQACGQPYATHRELEAPTFAEQRSRDLAQARPEVTPPQEPTDAEQTAAYNRAQLARTTEARTPLTPKAKPEPGTPEARVNARLRKVAARLQERVGPAPTPAPKARDPFEEEDAP